MANLKETRNRISSVTTTQQITKAMKLVAASKLRRAQSRIVQMRPYADKLYDMLRNIMAGMEGESISLNFNQEREIKNVLIVLVTSDKGLCGGFNSNLIKTTNKVVYKKYQSQFEAGNLELMTIGKKGNDVFSKSIDVNKDYLQAFSNLNFEYVSTIAEYAMDGFLKGKYDVVEVVYGKFKNAATQIISAEQFLPLPKLESTGESTMNADFIYEPQKAELVEELIPKILKTQFYRYLLDSNASEQGARMVAMDQATENANELLNDLKLVYNRERQAAITNEILEIVGGAAALEEG
ncbi:MAG: ATP synthase F1 subunit gamma [Chitinophagales bacterium]|nr:ATP synthase F1 subunit gamma [Chitinophagales bacterium]